MSEQERAVPTPMHCECRDVYRHTYQSIDGRDVDKWACTRCGKEFITAERARAEKDKPVVKRVPNAVLFAVDHADDEVQLARLKRIIGWRDKHWQQALTKAGIFWEEAE